jgi:hypothetical protein
MDDTLRDRTTGRHETPADAGDASERSAGTEGPAASRDRQNAGPGYTDVDAAIINAASEAAVTKAREIEQPDPATAPATRPTEPTATSSGVRVRLCKWCKQIDLRGARRQTDVIAILIIGEIVRACWNGKDMIVQDGICESCAAALKSGRVVDGSTTL